MAELLFFFLKQKARLEAVDPASVKINGSFPLTAEEAVAGLRYTTEYLLAAVHKAEFYLRKTLMLSSPPKYLVLPFSHPTFCSKIPLPEKEKKKEESLQNKA